MPKTPKRQQANLSLETIVSAAVELVERDGEQALSMRRLGSELGVQAMSLYHHVANRQELEAAIAARILQPAREVALGDDWAEATARFGRALRQVAVTHPHCFRLVGVQALEAPRLEAQRLLDVLVAAGFKRVEALTLYRAVASYARGYALGETAGFVVGAGEVDADKVFESGLAALVRGFADARRARAEPNVRV